jgi:CHRD domain
MFNTFAKSCLQISIFLLFSINSLIAQKFIVPLSGANESPSNASPGTGVATITITGNSMRVQCAFSGLVGFTTASHIHAATMVAFAGTAGVATVTPTFTGFPSGVTSGLYDHTFDMSLASSFNPSYITAHGGTAAQAWADLKTAMQDGKSYFNLHSSAFPGGEIRGFLNSKCTSTKTGNWNDLTVWSCGQVPTIFNYVTISSTHIVTIPDNIVANAKNIELIGELKKGVNSNLILNQ